MRYLAVAMSVALLAGCTNNYNAFGPSYVPQVDAAKAITDTRQKDDALRAVAHRAVDQGDAIVAGSAVEGFSDTRMHDETAAYCARKLTMSSRAGEAYRLAKQIDDEDLRNRVLKEIAISH